MLDALRILAALLLVGANAFFVAAEFSITRIRASQVTELEREGRRGARALRHAVENIDAYLAACQLGITLASIGLGVLAEPTFEHLLQPLEDELGRLTGIVATGLAFLVALGLVTLAHVVLGELAPKSLAIARTVRTALFIARPMRAFYLTTRLIVDLVNGLGNLVLRPFGIPPAREVGHAPHSEDELRLLLEQSVNEGLIDTYEREFAENVLLFGDLRVRQVMVPRGEVDYLLAGEPMRDAVARAAASMHTRLPLCEPEHGLDATIGAVNTKELFRLSLEGREADLTSLARPLMHVSESMLVDELLRAMRHKRTHFALVVDEFGTTVGLVTLEDVLEEIVGEFEEEEEAPAEELIRREDSGILIKGAAPIGLVEDELDIQISNGGEATIGGHFVEQLGRVPEPGEVLGLEGHEVEVVAVGEASILELRVRGGREAGAEEQ